MKIRDCFVFAATQLRKNHLRTALGIFAVAVGTASVLLVCALSGFAELRVAESVETLGVGGLAILADNASDGITEQTAERMEQELQSVRQAMAVQVDTGSVRSGYRSGNAVLLGVNEKMDRIVSFRVLHGNLISKRQAEQEEVAVVGDDLARALFGRTNIVSRSIKIRYGGEEHTCRVIGVIRAQTGLLGGALSAMAPYVVYVPYRCIASEDKPTRALFLRCGNEEISAGTETMLRRYLQERQKVEGEIQIRNLSGMVDTVKQVTALLRWLLIAFGSITFAVALIGIVNMLFSAAAENKEEIGICMALGASRRDIRVLYLVQAVMVCGWGGLLAATPLFLAFRLLGFPLWSPVILVALPLIVLSGAAAGLFPASRAANLDPVEAMRN